METVLPFSFMQFDFMKNALLAVLLLTRFSVCRHNGGKQQNGILLRRARTQRLDRNSYRRCPRHRKSNCMYGDIRHFIPSWHTQGQKQRKSVVWYGYKRFSSASIAIGIVILSQNGGFAKFSSYLIGDILTVSPSYVKILAVVLIATYIVWYFLFNKLLLTSINPSLSASEALKTQLSKTYL